MFFVILVTDNDLCILLIANDLYIITASCLFLILIKQFLALCHPASGFIHIWFVLFKLTLSLN